MIPAITNISTIGFLCLSQKDQTAFAALTIPGASILPKNPIDLSRSIQCDLNRYLNSFSFTLNLKNIKIGRAQNGYSFPPKKLHRANGLRPVLLNKKTRTPRFRSNDFSLISLYTTERGFVTKNIKASILESIFHKPALSEAIKIEEGEYVQGCSQ